MGGTAIAKKLSAPGLFLLLSLAAYSTILNSYFLSDDFAQIGRVLEGNYSVTWGLEHGGFFRPLFILSYIVDSKLWGTSPTGYHLTNVLLHGLNSYLVFLLAGRWLRTNRDVDTPPAARRVSIFAGLIFLLHPSHTESVSWIAGRADLLATLFFLAALLSFDSYKLASRIRYLAYTLVFFMLALLAKESAICLPLVILAVDTFSRLQTVKDFKSGGLKRIAKPGGLFTLIFSLYLLIRYAFLGTLVGGYGGSHHLMFKISLLWDRLPKFVLRAIMPPLPDQLSPMLTKPFKSVAFMLLAAFVIALASALVLYRRTLHSAAARKEQNAFLLLLLATFLFSLVPVITLGISVFETLGERFVYLPSIFSSMALAYVSGSLVPNSKRWIVLVACVLIFYSAALYKSNKRWNQAVALSQSVIEDIVRSSTHEDILVLDAPGSLRGVPVNRTGLEEALRVFQNQKRIKRVQVVAYLGLADSLGDTEVVQNSDNIEIRLLGEKMEFSEVNERVECAGILEKTKTQLRLKLNNCPAGQDRFFFQDGRMRRVH